MHKHEYKNYNFVILLNTYTQTLAGATQSLCCGDIFLYGVGEYWSTYGEIFLQ